MLDKCQSSHSLRCDKNNSNWVTGIQISDSNDTILFTGKFIMMRHLLTATTSVFFFFLVADALVFHTFILKTLLGFLWLGRRLRDCVFIQCSQVSHEEVCVRACPGNWAFLKHRRVSPSNSELHWRSSFSRQHQKTRGNFHFQIPGWRLPLIAQFFCVWSQFSL